MPELPEVETTLRALRPILGGKRFGTVEVLRPNMIARTPDLPTRIHGTTVMELERRGKYLLLLLDSGDTLVIHLKISGRLGFRKPSDPPLTYERIRMNIAGGILVFNDPRTLGRLWMLRTASRDAHPHLALLGPDALTASREVFLNRLARRTGTLKSVLLDQSFVAGIGNIYADEACFLGKISPIRSVKTLTQRERTALHRAVVKTLEKGVRNMGTSFSDFADLFGKPGQNQRTLMVYGRKGERCRSCKTALTSKIVGTRTTVWCPRCQK